MSASRLKSIFSLRFREYSFSWFFSTFFPQSAHKRKQIRVRHSPNNSNNNITNSNNPNLRTKTIIYKRKDSELYEDVMVAALWRSRSFPTNPPPLHRIIFMSGYDGTVCLAVINSMCPTQCWMRKNGRIAKSGWKMREMEKKNVRQQRQNRFNANIRNNNDKGAQANNDMSPALG